MPRKEKGSCPIPIICNPSFPIRGEKKILPLGEGEKKKKGKKVKPNLKYVLGYCFVFHQGRDPFNREKKKGGEKSRVEEEEVVPLPSTPGGARFDQKGENRRVFKKEKNPGAGTVGVFLRFNGKGGFV